jgi:CRP/FNR family transcriptional regulator, cyclic AMP receptor protein
MVSSLRSTITRRSERVIPLRQSSLSGKPAMDDLDFSGKSKTPPPAPSAKATSPGEPVSLYVPRLALEFFKLGGTLEEFPAGKQVFAENEKASGFFSKGARIYLLLDGEVALTRAGKPLELVLPGEIFGEMAAISETPRSATATARKNCRVLSLDEKQFLHALQRMPEFALMLMSVMAQRLRRGVARLAAAKKTAVEVLEQKNTLNQKMLDELQHELGDPVPAAAAAGKTVVTKGALGACMFVVTTGRIAILVDGTVIEHVGPGGAFGEMALVDRSGRSATAMAETESTWLLIGRNEFVEMVKTRPAFGVALMRSMSARVLHIAKLLGS